MLIGGKDRQLEIVSRARIPGIWKSLGGGDIRRGRARAFWRGGGSLNVALNDAKGVWYDHATGEGGGILDLIQRARGGTRGEAFRWLADYSGVPLDPLPVGERRRWARERAEIEQQLPNARLWRRSALLMADELLASLKSKLFNPTAGNFDAREISEVECIGSRLRNAGDVELVDEYCAWMKDHPKLTTAMVWAARRLEGAEQLALRRFIERMEYADADK
jgi:hypothetical protein